MNRAERRRQQKARQEQVGDAPEAALSQALACLQAGRLKRAEGLLRRVLKANPAHPDALHFQGVVLYHQGRYEHAIAMLSDATRVAPDYAEAHNSLGIVFLERRSLDEAAGCFRRAIELRPDFAGAHTNLGNALQDLGDHAAAVASYERGLELAPQSREAAYRLASTLLANGDPESALATCERCLEMDRHCQHALAYKAMALAAMGRTEEARAIYEYDGRICAASVEPPSSYDNADRFNDALEHAVRQHPSLVWEPFNRVTRGGAVTGDLLLKPTPVIRDFERTLRRTIDGYRDSLIPDASHPFLGRIPRTYRLTLIASILKAGGEHPPHIHEGAWLSGVYYVRIPHAVTQSDESHAGWLEFGRPDYSLPTSAKLNLASRQPNEGLALLFPSYFFHGTIPFEGEEERIGIAFDAYPQE